MINEGDREMGKVERKSLGSIYLVMRKVVVVRIDCTSTGCRRFSWGFLGRWSGMS